MRGPLGFGRVVVLNETSARFGFWLSLGALLAAPVFASSVVAIPLLLDRPVGVLAAVLTGWRVVQTHPLPMALWAALLVGGVPSGGGLGPGGSLGTGERAGGAVDAAGGGWVFWTVFIVGAVYEPVIVNLLRAVHAIP